MRRPRLERLERRELLASDLLPSGVDSILPDAACNCQPVLAAEVHVDSLFAPGTPSEYRDAFENHASDLPHIALYEFDDGDRWTRTSNQTQLRQGDPTTLTWSIVPDGTSVHGYVGEQTAPSDLQSRLNALYGTPNDWLPLFGQVFDRWSEVSGVTFVYEPNDDGAAMTANTLPPGIAGVRGDVRIAGHRIDGAFGTLAYNFFPDAGEMVIDTAELSGGGFLTNRNSNSLRFRNVVAHEVGHGLGIGHVIPTDETKLMEPYASTSFDGPQLDDILAVQRGYGDVFEQSGGNDASGSASDLGAIAVGQTVSLGLSGAGGVRVSPSESDFVSIDDNGDVDFFRFSVAAGTSASVTLTPVGPTYQSGPQGGNATTFDASAQSDLSLALLDSNGVTVLASANNTGLGGSETLTNVSLSQAGVYYVKVSGAQNTAQFYQLDVSITADQNLPPVVDDQSFTVFAGSQNGTVVGTIEASDPNTNDALTFSILAGNAQNALALDAATGQLTVNNSAALDPEVNPTISLTVQVRDPEGLTDTAAITVDVVPVPSIIGESGTITTDQADGTQWHTVTLSHSYANPVVILGPLSFNGGQPSTVRVRNVTSSSFQWQIDEWDYLDGGHTEETVGYLVIEAGTHTLTDGTRVVAGTTSAGDGWTAVGLSGFSAAPVVLAQVSSVNEPSAVTPRLQNVVAGGFEVRVQEEQAAGGTHADETVGYVAIEQGRGESAGQQLEAVRTADTITDDGATLSLTQTFASAPVLLATMQTFDGGDPAGLRYTALTASSVSLFVEEEQSADSEVGHTTEVVGLLALEAGLIQLVAENQPPQIDDQGFSVLEDSPAGTVVGTVVATDPDPNDSLTFSVVAGNADNAFALDPATGRLTVNNSAALDPDVNPTFALTVQVTDREGLSDSAAVTIDVTPVGNASVIGESGTISVDQADSGQWHPVTLGRSYTDPVVIMGPLSFNGGQPSTVRVRNVTGGGFEWQIDEWDYLDGGHTEETVGYLVVEAGAHTLSDGTRLVAGTTNASDGWTSVNLTGFGAVPVIIAQVASVNESSAVTPRLQNATADGFEVRVQEQETGGAHLAETIGYLAIEVGTGQADGVRFEAARTGDTVTDDVSTLTFAQDFAAAPVLLATLQTFDGSDPAGLRYTALSATSVSLFVEEEKSDDSEVSHTTEVVGFVALEAGDLIGAPAPLVLPDLETLATAALPALPGGQPAPWGAAKLASAQRPNTPANTPERSVAAPQSGGIARSFDLLRGWTADDREPWSAFGLRERRLVGPQHIAQATDLLLAEDDWVSAMLANGGPDTDLPF